MACEPIQSRIDETDPVCVAGVAAEYDAYEIHGLTRWVTADGDEIEEQTDDPSLVVCWGLFGHRSCGGVEALGVFTTAQAARDMAWKYGAVPRIDDSRCGHDVMATLAELALAEAAAPVKGES